MKVLVTGAGGQLGYDVVKELQKRGHVAVGADLAELDITDGIAVDRAVRKLRPDAVVHCAAWTAVDAAEKEENVAKVRAVNADGTANVARACKAQDCKLVYLSTDYVFGGEGEEAWKADCKRFAPCNVYGRTKLEGEFAVAEQLKKFFIVRIAWVFGAHGKNFVRTMLDLGAKYPSVRVVNDQIGTPSYTVDLARLIVDMAESEEYGFYHATNEGGYISWADFAEEIYRQAGLATQVIRVTTEEYGLSEAVRPQNSRLDKSKLRERGFLPLPDWRDALKRYLEEIGRGKN